MINERESKKEGYALPVRWLALREDLQKKYLSEANEMFDQFKFHETNAEHSRNKMDDAMSKLKHY
jgi:hypothetical protein